MADYLVKVVDEEVRVVADGEELLAPLVATATAARDAAQVAAVASAAHAALAAALALPTFADTTAGLAGTDVGDQFSVPSGFGGLDIYRHDAGPVASFVRHVAERPISVMDYGALADGETSDSTAIQTALNLAGIVASLRGVRVAVDLGLGTHALANGITVPAGVTLRGMGGGQGRLLAIYYRLRMTASADGWTVGQTITGGTSGATATIASKSGATVTLSNITGTFQAGESVTNTGAVAYTVSALLGADRLVTVQSGGQITDCEIDAAGLCTYSLIMTDAVGCKALRLHFKNWIYACVLENSARAINDLECSDIELGWLHFDSPAPMPVYPIWTWHKASKWIRRCRIHDITIKGRASTAYTQGGTADQLELQGLADSDVWNIGTEDGGELGIAFSRLCTNVRAWNIYAANNDADGIQLGSGFGELAFADVTGLVAGDLLKGSAGSVSIIEYVYTAQNKCYGTLSGNWAVGEVATQCIRLTVDSVAGLKTGQTLTGGTTGAKGVIERITDPANPRAPKQVYVSHNGVDPFNFSAPETVSNGTVTVNLTAVNQTPAISTPVTKTLTGIVRASDLVLRDSTCRGNGKDVYYKTITLDTVPSAWAVGDTITGGTSGATATVQTVDTVQVTISGVSGTFVDGESISNGTTAYTSVFVGAYLAGVKVMHADRVTITGLVSSGQKFGIYYTQTQGIFEAGNNLAGNTKGERSINGVCTFADVTLPAKLVASGGLALPRGTNRVADVNGAINVAGGGSFGASGTVKTLTGGTVDGELVILFWSGVGTNLTLQDAASGGNIDLPGGLTLDSATDGVLLRYRATAGRWAALAPLADNG